jgi:ribokinase
LVFGKEFRIAPGGKSRNIAQMMATYNTDRKVAMVGRTVRDPMGLWKIPLEALEESGVSTAQVKVLDFKESGGKFPGIALIPVDTEGENQIYVIPGVNDDFSPSDIDDAKGAFEEVARNKGILALSLELPLETAAYAVRMARSMGIQTILDPGGIQEGVNYSELVGKDLFLLKPNEHEAKILTGVNVVDFESAQKAAMILQARGVENVLITVGAKGAYLFEGKDGNGLHFPVPKIVFEGPKDATGCGDQVMAVLCAELSEGKSLKESTQAAILSGTLQFGRRGVVPVKKNEIKSLILPSFRA